MYTIILDQGIVIRDSDGVIVSPAESADNPDFVEYNTWAQVEGNTPTILDTAPDK